MKLSYPEWEKTVCMEEQDIPVISMENPLYHYAACVAAAVRVKSRGLSRSGRPGLSERAGRERVSR